MIDPLPCKAHDGAHRYTVCPLCEHQYCPLYWDKCPRSAWHQAHRNAPAVPHYSGDLRLTMDPSTVPLTDAPGPAPTDPKGIIRALLDRAYSRGVSSDWPECKAAEDYVNAKPRNTVGAMLEDMAARHRAKDPHCTCNDCIAHHAGQKDTK